MEVFMKILSPALVGLTWLSSAYAGDSDPWSPGKLAKLGTKWVAVATLIPKPHPSRWISNVSRFKFLALRMTATCERWRLSVILPWIERLVRKIIEHVLVEVIGAITDSCPSPILVDKE